MTTITYVEPSGKSVTLDVPEGWTLMQGAVANGIDGIVGECGGSCACATCHCYIDESRLAELPPPGDVESEMLECVVAERRPASRLACQLRAGPATEGLVLQLPDRQV